MLENLPLNLWETDARGVLIRVEGGLLARLGRDPGSYLGKELTEAVSAADKPVIARAFGRAMAGEESSFEIVVDEQVIYGLMAPRRGPGGQIAGAVAAGLVQTDHARRAAQEELRARGRRSEFVLRLARRALSCDELQPVFEEACAVAAEGIGLPMAGVLEVSTDDRIFARALYGWPKDSVGQPIARNTPESQAGTALRRPGEVIVAEDLAGRFPASPFLHRYGARSGLAVAIPGRTSPFGVLSAHSDRVRSYSPDETAFFKTVAQLVGLAAERRARAVELEKTVDALKAAYAVADIAFVETDVRTGEMQVSPEFLKLYGLKKPLPTREAYFGRIHPEDREKVRELADGLRSGAQSTEARYRVVRPDGATRWVQARGTVISDIAGRPARIHGVLHDVTERVQAHETETLRQRQELQREFLANLSHEFRTPLAAIKGFTETLLEGGALEDPKVRRRFVRSINAQADRLRLLVDNLLELSAYEGRRAPLRLSAVPLRGLARAVADGFQPAARRAGVTIRLAIKADLKVRADEAQLARVLSNLCDNAIKFNKRGGKVTVGAVAADGMAVLSVSDTGAGIHEAELDRIFHRFHRSLDAGRKKGTGLGLALAREIVQQHGGRLWVESAVGRGSTFRFTCPLS